LKEKEHRDQGREKKKDPEKHKTDECNVRKAKNVVAV
jgi:hypothetical protein